MPTSPLPNIKVRFWNRAGTAPLAGGKVYTYVAGSINTNKTSWKDANKAAVNTNPIILDAYGEADIWLDGLYKINLTDSADVNQWAAPIDNVASLSTDNIIYTTTGTPNAYILTPNPAIISYTDSTFTLITNFTNTGPATINISGLGAQTLTKDGAVALESGDMVSGGVYTITYDGSNFQVVVANVTGVTSAIDNEIVLFSGTTGKSTKRATGTGVVKATAGVFSVAAVSLTTEIAGILPVANGGSGRATNTAFGVVIGGATTGGIEQSVAAGTSGQVLMSNGAGVAPTMQSPQYMHVRDERAVGVNGGTSSAGLNIRVLNTVMSNSISGASLASNQITLPAGTYRIRGRTPCFAINSSKGYLYNTTDAAIAIAGSSVGNSTANSTQLDSLVTGIITIASTKVFELRHDIQTAVANTGLGFARNVAAAGVEVYTEIEITREA